MRKGRMEERKSGSVFISVRDIPSSHRESLVMGVSVSVLHCPCMVRDSKCISAPHSCLAGPSDVDVHS